MKIDFENDINGFQNARKLKMILEHYNQPDTVDRTTQILIETLIKQLDEFTAAPEFRKFNHTSETENTFLDTACKKDNFITRLVACWHVFWGPSRRELLLSRQRQELIERAERAEAIAFEAIAETADVGRQRDAVIKKLDETLRKSGIYPDSGADRHK